MTGSAIEAIGAHGPPPQHFLFFFPQAGGNHGLWLEHVLYAKNNELAKTVSTCCEWKWMVAALASVSVLAKYKGMLEIGSPTGISLVGGPQNNNCAGYGTAVSRFL